MAGAGQDLPHVQGKRAAGGIAVGLRRGVAAATAALLTKWCQREWSCLTPALVCKQCAAVGVGDRMLACMAHRAVAAAVKRGPSAPSPCGHGTSSDCSSASDGASPLFPQLS